MTTGSGFFWRASVSRGQHKSQGHGCQIGCVRSCPSSTHLPEKRISPKCQCFCSVNVFASYLLWGQLRRRKELLPRHSSSCRGSQLFEQGGIRKGKVPGGFVSGSVTAWGTLSPSRGWGILSVGPSAARSDTVEKGFYIQGEWGEKSLGALTPVLLQKMGSAFKIISYFEKYCVSLLLIVNM